MTATVLEITLQTLREILAASEIPDLECGGGDEKVELSLNLYRLEEE